MVNIRMFYNNSEKKALTTSNLISYFFKWIKFDFQASPGLAK